jgi:predicted secreted protein
MFYSCGVFTTTERKMQLFYAKAKAKAIVIDKTILWKYKTKKLVVRRT